MNIKILSIIAVSLILFSPVAAETAAKDIIVLNVSGTINPATAGFMATGIQKANEQSAACIIIELDTPGGLTDSMREIVKAIFASEIPVIVYVTPEGARAASAGVMITMAADVAAMAPGTNIGAAHPVSAGGGKIDETMEKKIMNDMAAYVRSIAQKRDRNIKWSEEAVRESVSATAEEALEKKVIDLIAKDTDDLIAQINGRKIKDKGILKLDNAQTVKIEGNLRTKILTIISDPNIAYILMMIGMAGLWFEISHPGAVLPGAVGAISLVLAFFAFQTLPVNYAGIMLIFLAVIFFILEIKITSFGLLSIAGIICMTLGSLMLYDTDNPLFKLSLSILLPTVTTISGFFIFIATLVMKSQFVKPKTGDAGIIGETGIARTQISNSGKVFVHGELWNAVSDNTIEADRKVRVVGIEGLVLIVEPYKEAESMISTDK